MLAILATVILAYHNSFSVPFLFDDPPSIADNASIRELWPLAKVLTPPGMGETVTNRPVINCSLAVNYAVGELDVTGYHAVNLAIHLFAALTLFGIIRRTLRQPVLSSHFGETSDNIALVAALWWALHPLQTEAVTYIVQRAESLMGLFYLLTLYTAIRAMESSAHALRWKIAAFLACLTGMACKEVMVSAPLIVLLYDRTFVAGTFRTAWDRRKWTYISLACTWFLLAWLILGQGKGSRGASCGYASAITWWDYLCTQSEGIMRYLKLSFWPNPLVFDYGIYIARDPVVIALCMACLSTLAILTAAALVYKPVWGFLGVWFFAILAPSSSVMPVVTQTLAEHRMYLSLAAILIPAAIGLYRLTPRVFLPVGLGLAGLLGWFTIQRNHDYRTNVAIWADTVAKLPTQARAHCNLGAALANEQPRLLEAISHFREAIRLNPQYGQAYSNLGGALLQIPGHAAEALSLCEKAVEFSPDSAETLANFGAALATLPNRLEDAIEIFRKAISLNPNSSQAYSSLGAALLQLPGRTAEAISACEKAVALRPDSADALANLGTALASQPDRHTEAIERFRQALKIKPAFTKAHSGLGSALLSAPDQEQEAVAHLEEALRLAPDDIETHVILGEALSLKAVDTSAAVAHLERATALNPNSPKVWNNIGVAWARIPGRQNDAIAAYELALRLNPDAWDVHLNFATFLTILPDRAAEAVTHFEAVVKLAPDNLTAHTNLGILLADNPNRLTEAVAHFEVVARATQNSHDAQYNLGTALSRIPSRRLDAIAAFRAALKLDPADAEAENNLGLLLSQTPEQTTEAIAHFEAALQLKPDLAEAHFNLGKTLAAMTGRLPEARQQLQQALALSPDYGAARELLNQLQTGK